MPTSVIPYIPETIVVHLGAPTASAANVTVPFTDYVKNVVSSEIYPTWEPAALEANTLAIISFALNRYYTEYYRCRGRISAQQSLVLFRDRMVTNCLVFARSAALRKAVRRKAYSTRWRGKNQARQSGCIPRKTQKNTEKPVLPLTKRAEVTKIKQYLNISR